MSGKRKVEDRVRRFPTVFSIGRLHRPSVISRSYMHMRTRMLS